MTIPQLVNVFIILPHCIDVRICIPQVRPLSASLVRIPCISPPPAYHTVVCNIVYVKYGTCESWGYQSILSDMIHHLSTQMHLGTF